MSLTVYRKGNFEITRGLDKNNKLYFWAYKLPYYENVKKFTDLKEAKKYINNLIKEQEV